MKVTWLGGASLLFEDARARILVDPVACAEGADVVLLTRDHAEHLSKETVLSVLAKNPEAVVLASRSAYDSLADLSEKYNIAVLAPHSVWSEKGITFYAVSAACADEKAAGFILDDGNKTFYVSGDTLYNYEVLDDVLDLVEDGVDYAFLPINGRGGSMNAKDAADFAYELSAENAVPLWYGAHPGDPDAFDFEEGKLVLTKGEATEL